MDELQRAIEQLFGRMTGPLYFRLILQPIMATVLAIRAGLRDERENRSAFFWEVVSNPEERRRLLHSAWKDVGRVIILAVVIDTVYQVWVLKSFYLLQALIVTFLLSVFPYILIRGPVTRFTRKLKSSGSE
jgi:hypothetical protein